MGKLWDGIGIHLVVRGMQIGQVMLVGGAGVLLIII